MSSLNIRAYDSTVGNSLQADASLGEDNTSLYIKKHGSDKIGGIYTIKGLPSSKIIDIKVDQSKDILKLVLQGNENIDLSFSLVLGVCGTSGILFNDNIQGNMAEIHRIFPELTDSYIRGKKSHEIIMLGINNRALVAQLQERSKVGILQQKIQIVSKSLSISLQNNLYIDTINPANLYRILGYITTFPVVDHKSILEKCFYIESDNIIDGLLRLLKYVKGLELDEVESVKYIKSKFKK